MSITRGQGSEYEDIVLLEYTKQINEQSSKKIQDSLHLKISCKEISSTKILAMLSGGKDSIAALIMLKKRGFDVSAIHFLHKWCSSIPTNEAKRICKEYNIKLSIIDFSDEFKKSILGYAAGRPCALCKFQMYKILLNSFSLDDYNLICIGDNANDTTTIKRIENYLSDGNEQESLICNRYFGTEMGIKLPDGIRVIRPLIYMNTEQIENFLYSNDIHVKRINSTGDKYFEYHREGCFVQFADPGVPFTDKIFDDLLKYNKAITDFAREKGILASVHIPSTFIVTIPTGYEEQASNYLINRGFNVDKEKNSLRNNHQQEYFVIIDELRNEIFSNGVYDALCLRLFERLGINMEDILILLNNEIRMLYHADKEGKYLTIIIDKKRNIINLLLKIFDDNKNYRSFLENLVIEIFKTRKYRILS